MAKSVEQFTSRWGMMLAMLGMAVGTGNIWRFPRVAASNGGGSFLSAWVCFLLLLAGLGDVIWWIVPSLPHPHGGLHVPMAIAAVVGLGGIWGLVFARELSRRPVLPANREGAFLANWGHH